MSYWQEYNFEERIKNILKDAVHPGKKKDIEGKPFMTVYQIALEFNRLYSQDVEAMEYSLNYAGTPGNKSLPQYIAMQLSKRIKKGDIKEVEECLLSQLYGNKIIYNGGEELIESPLTEAKTNRLLYRYK